MQISAIFSDYDGTLSPTTYLNSDNKTLRIPNYHSQTQLVLEFLTKVRLNIQSYPGGARPVISVFNYLPEDQMKLYLEQVRISDFRL